VFSRKYCVPERTVGLIIGTCYFEPAPKRVFTVQPTRRSFRVLYAKRKKKTPIGALISSIDNIFYLPSKLSGVSIQHEVFKRPSFRLWAPAITVFSHGNYECVRIMFRAAAPGQNGDGRLWRNVHQSSFRETPRYYFNNTMITARLNRLKLNTA